MRKPTSRFLKPYGIRLFHMTLALAVILQLLTSLAMQAPRPGRPANALFSLHEYSGLLALVLAFGFWLVIALRRGETETGLLVPWFSASRRAAFVDDLMATFRTVRRLRLPAYDPASPLASAIHGLGLLLMTGMAASGSVYYLAELNGVQDTLLPELIIDLHGALANLVWAYLIAHAAMASLHQVSGHFNIRDMWTLKRE